MLWGGLFISGSLVRVQRASGVSCQARIKHRGQIVQTRTFRTKSEARDWARQYQARLAISRKDREPGWHLTVAQGAGGREEKNRRIEDIDAPSLNCVNPKLMDTSSGWSA